MAFGGTFWGRVLVLALTVSVGGCGSKAKRAPLIDSSPNAGSKPDVTGDGSAGAGDGTISNPKPPIGIGGPGGGGIGAGDVSILGTLGGGYLALAALDSPNSYVVGFDTFWSGFALQGSSLLYLNDHKLYQFVEDGAFSQRLQDIKYPTGPGSNDMLIDTPQCNDVHLESFLITSGGRLLYGCSAGSTTSYYDVNAKVFASSEVDLLAVGANDLGLAASRLGVVTVSLASPTDLHSVTDIQLPPLAYRAHKDGFYVAETGANIYLFQVNPDGSSENLGTYAREPDGIYPYQGPNEGVLTNDGTLYEIGNRTSNDQKVIMRRTIDGTSEIVYDEADDPHVELSGFGKLLTSP